MVDGQLDDARRLWRTCEIPPLPLSLLIFLTQTCCNAHCLRPGTCSPPFELIVSAVEGGFSTAVAAAPRLIGLVRPAVRAGARRTTTSLSQDLRTPFCSLYAGHRSSTGAWAYCPIVTRKRGVQATGRGRGQSRATSGFKTGLPCLPPLFHILPLLSVRNDARVESPQRPHLRVGSTCCAYGRSGCLWCALFCTRPTHWTCEQSSGRSRSRSRP